MAKFVAKKYAHVIIFFVDQNLKIHGLDGIRVADASIMPDTVRANTNVTTMMIGERVASFVNENPQ